MLRDVACSKHIFLQWTRSIVVKCSSWSQLRSSSSPATFLGAFWSKWCIGFSPLDVLKYLPKQACFVFVLEKDILRKFACTNQELRVCCDYVRSRTSVLELHVRTFPKIEAALFSTNRSPSDCTFMRLGSSLYGKALSIGYLAKLFRSWFWV